MKWRHLAAVTSPVGDTDLAIVFELVDETLGTRWLIGDWAGEHH